LGAVTTELLAVCPVSNSVSLFYVLHCLPLFRGTTLGRLIHHFTLFGSCFSIVLFLHFPWTGPAPGLSLSWTFIYRQGSPTAPISSLFVSLFFFSSSYSLLVVVITCLDQPTPCPPSQKRVKLGGPGSHFKSPFFSHCHSV